MITVQLENVSREVDVALKAAHDNAARFGRSYIGAEDVLFGLMYSPGHELESSVARIMRQHFDVGRSQVSDAIKGIAVRSTTSVVHEQQLSGGIRFTRSVLRALKLSGALGAKEHTKRFDILLGLIRTRDAMLLHVLKELNIDPKRLEEVAKNPNMPLVGSR